MARATRTISRSASGVARRRCTRRARSRSRRRFARRRNLRLHAGGRHQHAHAAHSVAAVDRARNRSAHPPRVAAEADRDVVRTRDERPHERRTAALQRASADSREPGVSVAERRDGGAGGVLRVVPGHARDRRRTGRCRMGPRPRDGGGSRGSARALRGRADARRISRCGEPRTGDGAPSAPVHADASRRYRSRPSCAAR